MNHCAVRASVAEFFAPSSEAAVTPDYDEISIELPGVSDEDIKDGVPVVKVAKLAATAQGTKSIPINRG